MRCYRKILRISYKDHVTNKGVLAKIQQAIRPHKDLLTIVKRRKLQWYAHVSRSSGLAKTILQGTVKGGKKTRQTEEEVGRQHQRMDRPGVRQVPEGSGEQEKMEEACWEIICGAPTTLAVKGQMRWEKRDVKFFWGHKKSMIELNWVKFSELPADVKSMVPFGPEKNIILFIAKHFGRAKGEATRLFDTAGDKIWQRSSQKRSPAL